MSRTNRKTCHTMNVRSVPDGKAIREGTKDLWVRAVTEKSISTSSLIHDGDGRKTLSRKERAMLKTQLHSELKTL